MATQTCSAFLQTQWRPVHVRVGAANRLLVGTKVGAWRIRDWCREGADSATYAVVNEQGGADAALTIIDTPALALGSYTRRIFALGQILMRLDHPGVVSVVDAGLIADGRPYVVTELHAGITLADALHDGPIGQVRAVSILRGICAALIAAHEIGIVHGSLDLDHVLLTGTDSELVKLLDWGVERAVFDEARRAGNQRSAYKVSAPEEIVGVVSPQTDAFSVGVVAHHLLYGGAPTAEWSVDDLCVIQAVPPALTALVHDLLAPDPRERPTMRAAADRLAAVAVALALPPPPPPPKVIAIQQTDVDDVPSRRYAQMPTWVSAVSWAAVVCAITIAIVVGKESRGRGQASAASLAERPHVAQPVVVTPGPADVLPVVVTPVVAARPVVAKPVVAKPVVAAPVVAEPVVAAPVVAAPVTARPVVATPIVSRPVVSRPVVARPVVARPAVAEPVDVRPRVAVTREQTDAKAKLLMQYQRIGRDLMLLRNQRGAGAIAELSRTFESVNIHTAVASADARAEATATLDYLRQKIERNRAVEPSPECLQNPLADGCR